MGLSGRMQAAAGQAARQAMLVFVALMALVAGLAFITLAAWLVLVQTQDRTFAALVLGLVYLGIALMLAGIALYSRGRPADPPDERQQFASGGFGESGSPGGPATRPPIMAAFLFGLNAGIDARRERLRRRRP